MSPQESVRRGWFLPEGYRREYRGGIVEILDLHFYVGAVEEYGDAVEEMRLQTCVIVP